MARYPDLLILSFSTSVPNLVLLLQNAQLLCYATALMLQFLPTKLVLRNG